MKLISTTNYVLWLRSMTTTELINQFPHEFHLPTVKNGVEAFLANDAILWMKVGEYAKFLKRPLQLSMFIPCNASNKPLHEPKYHKAAKLLGGFQTRLVEELAQYQVAKNKVLFKNVKYIENVISIRNQRIGMYPNINNQFSHLKYQTIEDLLSLEINLVKQI